MTVFSLVGPRYCEDDVLINAEKFMDRLRAGDDPLGLATSVAANDSSGEIADRRSLGSR